MILKDILISKGVKQKWLANKMGVSEVTVSNWCKQKSDPSKQNLKRISDVLEIPLRQLLNQ